VIVPPMQRRSTERSLFPLSELSPQTGIGGCMHPLLKLFSLLQRRKNIRKCVSDRRCNPIRTRRYLLQVTIEERRESRRRAEDKLTYLIERFGEEAVTEAVLDFTTGKVFTIHEAFSQQRERRPYNESII